MNITGKLLTIMSVLLLGACNCDSACIAERESREALAALKDAKNCVPVLVSVAEDGTKLWKVGYNCSELLPH